MLFKENSTDRVNPPGLYDNPFSSILDVFLAEACLRACIVNLFDCVFSNTKAFFTYCQHVKDVARFHRGGSGGERRTALTIRFICFHVLGVADSLSSSYTMVG